MKSSTITFLVIGLWHAIPLAAEPVVPESKNDKVIYSLGYELGTDIKAQDLDLIPEMLLQGARDAIEGKKAQVKKSEQIKALKAIKEHRAQVNLENSQAFLLENAKKEGVVTLDSGLQYREIKAGEGKSPQLTNSVTVNYRGTLIDGSEFDSSYSRGKPSSFHVKKVIRGWREALQLMNVGAQWELFIPPDLAYGKRGHTKAIPPNSALIYQVELISVK